MTSLHPADLFDLRFVHDARFSPAGQQIACTVSQVVDGVERFEIWIEEEGAAAKRRLPFPGSAKSPRWSPDGRSIAFIGDNRLHVASFPSLQVGAALTPAALSVAGVPSWSPDSARIVVSLFEHRRHEGARRISTNHFRSDGLGYLEGLSQRLYVAGRDSGSLRCLAESQGLCKDPEWSPTGRHILFIELQAGVPAVTYPARLRTIDVEDGSIADVLQGRWSVTCARWLPDGERIALAADRDLPDILPTLALWVVSRTGGHAELRTPGLIGSLGIYVEHDMPLWDSMFGANSLTVLDGQSAIAGIQRGGNVELWRVGLSGDISYEPVCDGPRTCFLFDSSTARGAVLYANTDLRTPTELFRCDLKTREETRLTALNDAVLARWPKVKVESLRFDTPDALTLDAWFLAPAGRDRPLPTVLYIHGGPMDATGNAFRYDFHMLAAAGFGVMFANFRGSMGYGAPFMRLIGNDWGSRASCDHLGALDAATARGWTDPERLGVWGYSHGGFATCWLVGHTRRFKAAVAENGVPNLTTMYYVGDVPDLLVELFGGRPHEVPDVYRSRSPISYAHRCRTPTLLLHGEDDFRCPISGAEEFHRALRDVGCITEMFRIPECSHNGPVIGPPSARLAQNEALLDWFQRYL